MRNVKSVKDGSVFNTTLSCSTLVSGGTEDAPGGTHDVGRTGYHSFRPVTILMYFYLSDELSLY